MSDQPISEGKQGKELPGGCLVLFGSIFFLVGSVAFWFVFLAPMLTFLSAQSWQSSDCQILTAKLTEIDGDDGSTWRADFTYQFEVEGQRYVGDRDRVSSTTGSRKSARNRLARFPVGTETRCWYDPANPEDSLLDRSVSWLEALVCFFGPLIFVGVGGSVMYLGFAQRRKLRDRENESKRAVGQPASLENRAFHPEPIRRDLNTPTASSTASSPARAVASPGLSSDDVRDREADPPQRLKPTSSRWGRLLGLLFICLFWNGIVSIFVWNLVFDPPFGALWGRIGLGLFLIPFVLIGILMIAGLVHSAISMFNASVSIALSTGAVPRGGSVDVAWEISGGLRALRWLNVSVVGTEWTQYVQGTDTHTEESIFEIVSACETDQPDEIRFGSATVIVPVDTMHTLDESRNKIKWEIHVHGMIPWWPDISERFPFRVTPAIVDSNHLATAEDSANA